jgi:phage baseplate assembly protein W
MVTMYSQRSGFSFPFRLNEEGGTACTAGPEKISENIKHLLLIGPGERVMRRDYGSGLRQLVHDPNNNALLAIVQHQIAKAINRWEPEVQVQSVVVTPRAGELFVEVLYLASRTGHLHSLSVPVGLGGI